MALTKLLVSVRNAREAELVACHKIGILDVKEPSRGGLGASDRDTLKEIAEVVRNSNRQFDLSFAAGELVQWYPLWGDANRETDTVPAESQSLPEYYGLELLSQYRFVKVGLAGVAVALSTEGEGIPSPRHSPIEGATESFPCGPERIEFDWQSAWRELFVGLPEQARPVAVSYLDFRNCDAPSPSMVLQLAAETKNCEVVLFDTCYKSGNLFSHVSISELNELVERARGLGLIPVVAGSVCLSCLSDVVGSSPDFVGIRGAVCRGDRAGEILPDLVEEFVDQLNAVVWN